ncbi:MAG: protein kinase [Opitutaceae bacterium]
MNAPASEADCSGNAPRIPDYELLRLIGRGSYGDVWLARGVTGLFRAVKIVWRERFQEAAPFEREFHGLTEFAAISLRERIQLALLHIGRNDRAGFFYYVMEMADDAERGTEIVPANYVPLTLAELSRRRGRLPAAECATVGIELARALADLHRHGLVHRDIKPSNVIIVGGVPKLADIGLVAAVNGAMTVVGTEGFMPPEGPGTPSADVFALGKVLYELATGLDQRHFPQLPPNLAALPDRRTLLALNEAILRACEPRPERRFADGAALLEALRPLQTAHGARRRHTVAFATAAILSVAGVGLGVWSWWPSSAFGIRRTADTRALPLPDPARIAPERSLIVLPLANLSEDKADFFAEGMHAEIIHALGRIPGLKVIGRTTASLVHGREMPLPEIGRRFGVENVIAGNVRRERGCVRIQLDLRRTRDDALLWSQTYERTATAVLSVQTEIADQVARAMEARTVDWKQAARLMTANPRAHDLVLSAQRRLVYEPSADPDRDFREAIAELEEALRLDPDYMTAAAELSIAYARLHGFFCRDLVARREYARKARYWGERAARLMPGGAGNGALAYYYYIVEQDADRAVALAVKQVEAWPNDPGAYCAVALGLSAMGRLSEAEVWNRRAIELDPCNPTYRTNEIIGLFQLRRRDAWLRSQAEYTTIAPESERRLWHIVFARFALFGELPETLDGVAAASGARLIRTIDFLLLKRRYEEALALIQNRLSSSETGDLERFRFLCRQCDALRRLGREAEAAAVARTGLSLAERMKEDFVQDGSEPEGRLADALVRVGRIDEAIAAGRRYVEALRVPAQQQERWFREMELAQLYGEAARPRECAALVARLLRVPCGLTVWRLRGEHYWDHVRDDPEFAALLNDPANDAPF